MTVGMPERSPADMRGSRRTYVVESAVASTIFSLGTGNFLAGLLSWMGASPSMCAVIGALPQLGCIMQLISPFLFERLPHRKRCIILCCALFRFSLGLAGFLPVICGGTTDTVFVLYMMAFLIAGFVTPGLNQWIMDLAPTEGRGRFFGRISIASGFVNGLVTFGVGWQLDRLIAAGRARDGYLLVFAVVLALSGVDLFLQLRIHEPDGQTVTKLQPRDLLRPLRDKQFRPIVLFITLWFVAQNISSGFLPVYELTVLRLDHRMITGMTVLASIVSIGMSWVWGRLADRIGWKKVLICGCGFMALGWLGWCVLPTSAAMLAPVIQCVITCGSGAYGLANLNLQYAACPPRGKTAYLGVTATASNLLGYVAVVISAQVQPYLAVHFTREGIPVLFALSAASFALCGLMGHILLKDHNEHRDPEQTIYTSSVQGREAQ